MDADQTDNVLATIQQNLIEIGGQITGIKPAIEGLYRLHEIMVVLAKNPAQGRVKIVSELLKTPENKIKNLLQSPQNFLQKGELFLKDPAANYWGALAVWIITHFYGECDLGNQFYARPKTYGKSHT